MEHEIKVGTVLMKDGTVLPEALRVDGGPGVAGWTVVNDFDGYGLDQAIRKIRWTYFCLAGEVKTTVFGIDHQSMIRRAVERLLARGKSDGFNSLEITQVASARSERFPLVRYVTVSAQWRHIQESPFLGRGLQKKSASSTQSPGVAEMPLSQELPKQAGRGSDLESVPA